MFGCCKAQSVCVHQRTALYKCYLLLLLLLLLYNKNSTLCANVGGLEPYRQHHGSVNSFRILTEVSIGRYTTVQSPAGAFIIMPNTLMLPRTQQIQRDNRSARVPFCPLLREIGQISVYGKQGRVSGLYSFTNHCVLRRRKSVVRL